MSNGRVCTLKLGSLAPTTGALSESLLLITAVFHGLDHVVVTDNHIILVVHSCIGQVLLDQLLLFLLLRRQRSLLLSFLCLARLALLSSRRLLLDILHRLLLTLACSHTLCVNLLAFGSLIDSTQR